MSKVKVLLPVDDWVSVGDRSRGGSHGISSLDQHEVCLHASMMNRRDIKERGEQKDFGGERLEYLGVGSQVREREGAGVCSLCM